jgi:hypothetical protein
MRKRKNNNEMIANVIGGIVIGVCSVVIVGILFLGSVQSFGGNNAVDCLLSTVGIEGAKCSK